MWVKNIADSYISSNISAIWYCYKDILFAHGFRARLVDLVEKLFLIEYRELLHFFNFRIYVYFCRSQSQDVDKKVCYTNIAISSKNHTSRRRRQINAKSVCNTNKDSIAIQNR